MDRKTTEVHTATPWGAADMVTKYARGINFYSTPGHGGFHLSAKQNALVPDYFKSGSWAAMGIKGWYEEDCDWAIVALVFPEHFEPREIEQARESLKTYLPEAYAKWQAAWAVAV